MAYDYLTGALKTVAKSLDGRVTAVESGIPETDIPAIAEQVAPLIAVDVTKDDVGLGDVDNTSDAAKVASGPIAEALSFKGPSYFSKDVATARNLGAFDAVVLRRWSNTSRLCHALYGKTVGNVEPTHEMKFPDSAGNWFECVEPEINLLMAGADPSGSIVDVTAAFQRAVSPNRPVFLPVGTYDLFDMVTLNPGQKVRGVGRMRSVINVTSGFNMSALGVLRFAPGESHNLIDVGISFNQPAPFAGMTRADLIHYPPAVYGVGAGRYVLDRVRISGAWDGVKSDDGNSGGGADIGTIEIGCFNKGFAIDGALDFVNINTFRFWGYGIGEAGTPDGDLFRDGTTVAMEIGRVDSLNIGTLAVLRGNIVVKASADNGLPIVIRSASLDSNPQLKIQGGRVYINSGYSSSAAEALLAPILQTGGYLETTNFEISNSGAHKAVDQSGGRFKMRGGRLLHYSDAFPAVDNAGGRLTIEGTEVLPLATRTTPYIKAGAFSQITGIVAADAPSGAFKKLIQITADNANVNVQGNQLNGWELDIPVNANLGIYGPNGKSEDWTPTLAFATMGDAVFAYTSRLGKIYRDNFGYRFVARIEFATNAYTTASGAFVIKGLPGKGNGISGDPVAIGAESLIDLPAGYTQIAAGYSTSTLIDPNGHISFSAIGDNVGLVALTTTHIKPSVSGFVLILSGYVATR